jgi:hypothetical protein
MTTNLENTTPDIIAATTKGILGAVPIIGPLAAEVVGTLIPNQRLDRIKDFLEALEARVGSLEQGNLRARCIQPESVDLMEDAFYSSGRALSKDRIDYIAELIANYISDEQAEHIRAKKMLSLLNELNDTELMILINYGHLDVGDSTFMKEHQKVVGPMSVELNAATEVREKAQLQESYKRKLVEVSLLRPRFKKTKKGEFPEFDERTGMIKASGMEITPFGRLFLRHIGQMPERK